MELSNLLGRYRGTSVAGLPEWDEAVRLLLLMLAPAAPHITEELWSRRAEARGDEWESIHVQRWPEVDETAIVEATRELPIQVTGSSATRSRCRSGSAISSWSRSSCRATRCSRRSATGRSPA